MTCREIYDPEDDLWLPTGYDGYFVSDSGHVWGPGRNGRGCLMHPTPGNRYGHLEVSIKINGRRIHEYVHRLVAEAFIPNPHNYPLVRHLNDDPTDNRVENLAWGTQSDNMQDAIEHGTFVYFSDQDRELAMQKRRTPIIAIDLSNGKEYEFESQQEASRVLGVNQSCIYRVLSGNGGNARGFYFMYANDRRPIDVSSIKYSRHGAPIRAIDLETGEEFIFVGQTEAARELGMSVSSVSMVLSGKMRQAKGYVFEYVKEEGIYRD